MSLFRFREILHVAKEVRLLLSALGAVLLSMLISSIFAEAGFRTASLKYSLRFATLILLFIVLATLFRSRRYRDVALRALTGAVFGIALIGIAEHFFPTMFEPLFTLYKPNRFAPFDPGADLVWSTGAFVLGDRLLVRASSVFPYCNSLAYFLVLSLFLLVHQIGREKPGDWRNFMLASVPIALVALYFTYSRGAMLALLIGAGGMVLSFSNDNRRILKSAAVILALVVIGTAVFLSMPQRHIHRMDSMKPQGVDEGPLSPFAVMGQGAGDGGASLQNRVDLWKAAGRLFADRPVIGWGVDSYRHLFYRFVPWQSHDLFFGRGRYQAHNLPLGIGAHQGVLGLGALLFLFITVAWKVGKNRSKTIAALLGFFIVVVIANLYDWVWVDLYGHAILLSGWLALWINESDEDD